MKKLLIGLFAFALTLGVACKKETIEPQQKSQVFKSKASISSADTGGDDGGIGGYPGGQYTYPHSTGLCYCGVYLVCHPAPPPPAHTHNIHCNGETGCFFAPPK